MKRDASAGVYRIDEVERELGGDRFELNLVTGVVDQRRDRHDRVDVLGLSQRPERRPAARR